MTRSPSSILLSWSRSSPSPDQAGSRSHSRDMKELPDRYACVKISLLDVGTMWLDDLSVTHHASVDGA
jgi:hypothetical protein